MDLVENGHRENGGQRWRCNTCRKSFQLNYRYDAGKQGIKEQIAELTLNGFGVRDISGILKINKNTEKSGYSNAACCTYYKMGIILSDNLIQY
jgi:transposase-like protein